MSEYGELIDNGQGGREYESYKENAMQEAREEWWETTHGDITFDDWLEKES